MTGIRASSRFGSIGIALVVACAPPATLAAEPLGTAVAVKAFKGTGPEAPMGKGMADLLIVDLMQAGAKCRLRLVEWMRRADALKEFELAKSPYADKSTFPQPGRLTQPDVFIDGVIHTTANSITWSLQATDAITGAVLAEDRSVTPARDFNAASEGIAQRLASKLCKVRAGYRITGRMDDATINGVVCGGLSRPFTATSPEVAGSWNFTPKGDTAGSFTYGAKNVGGATGSGAGTYTVIAEGEGRVRLQLAGTGRVHSPLGTFSAKITESLHLTPIPSCERVGDR